MIVYLAQYLRPIQEFLELPVLHTLESFFDIKKVKPLLSDFCKRNDFKIFLDSGVHSLLAQKKKLKTTLEDMEVYVNKYMDFIELHYDRLTCFAEMDIEQIWGQENVDRWYGMLKSVDPDNKIIRVYHPNHSFDRFRDYCDTSDYVGIGGGWNTKLRKFDVDRLFEEAGKCGTKLHGFGINSNTLCF